MKTRFISLAMILAASLGAWAQEEGISVRDSLYALAAEASVDEPLDMTLLINNPTYDGDNRSGWEGTGATAVTWGTWEHWNHSFDNWQVLGNDLPNGVYILNASSLHRVGNYYDEWYKSGKLANEEYRTAVLYGKSGGIDLSAPVMDLAACSTEEPASEYGTAQLADGRYIPDNPESFHYYTRNGYYGENDTYIAVTDGQLTIGWRDLNYIAGQWTIVDNWTLHYLGKSDDAYSLIKEQQTGLIRDLSALKAMEQLSADYTQAVDDFKNAEAADDMLAKFQRMTLLRDSLIANANAYVSYKEQRDKLIKTLEENEIYGEYRDILEAYLYDYEEECEAYPHGSSDYILDVMKLSTDELAAEMQYMEQLYTTAVEKGLGNHTNITYMVNNADFSQGNFAGWEYTRTNSGNFYSRTGGKGDGWQNYSPVWVGEAWNCSFDFHQTIDNNLPDGIYELTFNALYRPGQNKYFPAELLPIEVYMNDFTTPVQHIISDGLPKEDAQNHTNCWIDNVGTWPQDDYSLDYGYMPNSSHGASIAFNGGRYKQTAYAVVKGGKLTLGMRHTRRPYYDDDWCTWANWQLIYRAFDAEAVTAALGNMEERAKMLSSLNEKHIYAKHVTNLNDAIQQAKTSEDAEKRYVMLTEINDLIQRAYDGILTYDSLIAAVGYMEETAFSGNPNITESRLEELEQLFDQYWEGINAGSYTDDEARQIIKDIYAIPELDVIYCYGDMVDGDWDQPCQLYPLHKQENGHYTGTISLQDRSEGWGGRASFFFVYQGRRIGRQTGSLDRFFTPAHHSKMMGELVNKDDDCFNTTGGDFSVDIDLENMTIDMTPIGVFPWPQNVYLAGTLPTGHWQRNDACPLEHLGDGIYQGVVELENFQDGKAGVTLFACRDPYDWNHARYGNSGYTNDVTKDVVYRDLNRYRGDTKWLVPTGEYCIAFDMNNEAIVFCDPTVDAADGIINVDGSLQMKGTVEVYTLDGQKVYQGAAAGFRPTKGTYIVRSAGQSRKVSK